MIDLSNNPKCEKCNISWSKTVPLIYYTTILLCGKCLIDIQKKDNENKRKLLLE